MTRDEWKKLISSKIVFLDGATGSNLSMRGMPSGVCPEKWILENEEVMIKLQREFIRAGSDIIYAPTFTGNRIKLGEYGLENQIAFMNQKLAAISKEAVRLEEESGLGRKVYVAGDLTMTGQQLYPIGTMKFEELVEIYKEQAAYLLMAGVDLFVAETMMSLQETRAAVIAIREICDLPVIATLTFHEDGRTLFGTDPETAVVVLENLGADAVGVNCSTGPDKLITAVEKMAEAAGVPIIAKPNAGLPHLENGVSVFDMNPEEFSKGIGKLIDAGATIVGGCCGTTPEHIVQMIREMRDRTPVISFGRKARALATERKTLHIEESGKFMIVGERINPTGKKALQEELKNGELNIVAKFAEEQQKNGADILDVNVGMNGIDEKETMIRVIYELSMASDLPLCIDSSYVDVIEAALRIYPGRALINSISLEKEKFEKLIPIAKKYGAMFILLPLSDKGLPADLEEKKQIIHTILDEAKRYGFTEKDIIVDGLVATVGANKKAALETLETIRYCKEELGMATICGLSNISFGLPERTFVNASFLALAIKEGLTMAIANPSQDLLMNTAFATDLLLNKENADVRYIRRVSENPSAVVSKEKKNIDEGEKSENPVTEAVIKGNRRSIIGIVKGFLERGSQPGEIIDTMLIPAIVKVGELFDSQIYFLPQLINSAETMKMAIEYLEPMIKRDDTKKLATIVVATVEGDIHDIGKNLVVLMLRNYGYRVIDLGKDVPARTIVETAKKEKASIIGLSALMTTTMIQMKETVNLVKEEKLPIKVIIGGAVITQNYADEIGADGYSKDAQDAVKLVMRLLKGK